MKSSFRHILRQNTYRVSQKRGLGILVYLSIKSIFAEKPRSKHQPYGHQRGSAGDYNDQAQAGTCPAGAKQGVPHKHILELNQGVNIDCGNCDIRCNGNCIHHVKLMSCLTGMVPKRYRTYDEDDMFVYKYCVQCSIHHQQVCGQAQVLFDL